MAKTLDESLKDLDAMAAPGIWAAYTESQLAGTISQVSGQPVAACYDLTWKTGKQVPRPDTAVFIAALVNAYRSGQLVVAHTI